MFVKTCIRDNIVRDNYVRNVNIKACGNSSLNCKSKFIVPRAERWCVYCKLKLGVETIENEYHVLTQCPLYKPLKNKFKFYPNDPSELVGLLSNQNMTSMQATAIAKSVHSILTTNLCYTDYYKSGELLTNCGNCTIL